MSKYSLPGPSNTDVSGGVHFGVGLGSGISNIELLKERIDNKVSSSDDSPPPPEEVLAAQVRKQSLARALANMDWNNAPHIYTTAGAIGNFLTNLGQGWGSRRSWEDQLWDNAVDDGYFHDYDDDYDR